MPDEFITCPECGAKIQLTQALTHDIEEKVRQQLNIEFDAKSAKERVLLEEKARTKAEEAVSVQMRDLRAEVEEKSSVIKEAQEQELAARKKQRELEEKIKATDLDVARRVDEERQQIERAATEKAVEAHRLKDREKDKKIADMTAQIDELKRKAEQGSEQIQGEIQELELEDILRQKFPFDEISPVSKGIKGADVLQIVHSTSGQTCGVILWESKRTKSWNNDWIGKIKDDQREAKADIAAIVSATLPKEISRFDLVSGVWVTDLACAVPLAAALREKLAAVFESRAALVGKSQKMEVLYEYLSGLEFKQRVQALAESFIAMKIDLDREKRAVERLWAKRQKQIDRLMTNTAGMYGDLQGIIGASLPELEILQLPSGDGNTETNQEFSS